MTQSLISHLHSVQPDQRLSFPSLPALRGGVLVCHEVGQLETAVAGRVRVKTGLVGRLLAWEDTTDRFISVLTNTALWSGDRRIYFAQQRKTKWLLIRMTGLHHHYFDTERQTTKHQHDMRDERPTKRSCLADIAFDSVQPNKTPLVRNRMDPAPHLVSLPVSLNLICIAYNVTDASSYDCILYPPARVTVSDCVVSGRHRNSLYLRASSPSRIMGEWRTTVLPVWEARPWWSAVRLLPFTRLDTAGQRSGQVTEVRPWGSAVRLLPFTRPDTAGQRSGQVTEVRPW